VAIDLSKFQDDNTSLILHLVDSKLNLSHLEYWIDIFSKCQKVFSCLVRDKKSFKEIVSIYPNQQILLAETPVDVEKVINTQLNLKSIFYPVNNVKNIHLLRFIELNHIFIGTKNSDQLSLINKSYRAYDEIWLSSQFMIDKYKESLQNLGHLKLKIVGKPQLKEVFEVQKTLSKNLEKIFIYVSKKDEALLDYLGELLPNLRDKQISILIERSDIKQQVINFLKGYSLNVNLSFEKDSFDRFALDADILIMDKKSISVYHLAYNKYLAIYLPLELKREEFSSDLLYTSYKYFSSVHEFQTLSFNDKEYNSVLTYNTQYFLGKNETLENSFVKECKVLT
jgi:hypothetical protein